MEKKEISSKAIKIFKQSIDKYHVIDNVGQPFLNPFPEGEISHLLYHKNWVDVVQWHYEDLVRDPEIEPALGMSIKRKIDASNQVRTDIVEKIDAFFLEKYKNVKPMTVYRSLKNLQKMGIVHKSNQSKIFFVCKSDVREKHNPTMAICKKCNKTEEIDTIVAVKLSPLANGSIEECEIPEDEQPYERKGASTGWLAFFGLFAGVFMRRRLKK